MLQTTTVFTNVSKAAVAKHEDLVDVFGTDDEEKVCLRILAEGDLQVWPHGPETRFPGPHYLCREAKLSLRHSTCSYDSSIAPSYILLI